MAPLRNYNFTIKSLLERAPKSSSISYDFPTLLLGNLPLFGFSKSIYEPSFEFEPAPKVLSFVSSLVLDDLH